MVTMEAYYTSSNHKKVIMRLVETTLIKLGFSTKVIFKNNWEVMNAIRSTHQVFAQTLSFLQFFVVEPLRLLMVALFTIIHYNN